jgi:hypothetical protein
MVRQRFGVAGRIEINQLGADGHPNLLPRPGLDLAQLTQGFGLPVDQIHEQSIS